jgi:hypothetical protein
MEERNFKCILKEVVNKNMKLLADEKARKLQGKKSHVSSNNQVYALLESTRLLLKYNRTEHSSASYNT